MKPPLAALLLAGCVTRDVSELVLSPSIELRQLIPATAAPRLDILFVVDNSDSMKEEQESLARNFPRFMEVLSSIEGGLPSVHIGVVSSSIGIAPFAQEGCPAISDDGALQSQPRGDCAAPDGHFIEDVVLPDGARRRNYAGSLADSFACIARLGTSGCGYEQHLEAMRRALDGSRAENAGFLRDDAYLAVVIIADEDDCSARDPGLYNSAPELDTLGSELGPAEFRCFEQSVTCDGAPPPRATADLDHCVPREDSYLRRTRDYVEGLYALKAERGLVITAAIAGDRAPVGSLLGEHSLRPRPSCVSASGEARPGIRLGAFVDAFGDNGRFLSICDGDLTSALSDVATLLARKISAPCLAADVATGDVDPGAPGTQLECVVSDIGFGKATVIPRCPGPRPCWSVEPRATCGGGLALLVDRDGDAPEGTRVVAECRAAR